MSEEYQFSFDEAMRTGIVWPRFLERFVAHKKSGRGVAGTEYGEVNFAFQ